MSAATAARPALAGANQKNAGRISGQQLKPQTQHKNRTIGRLCGSTFIPLFLVQFFQEGNDPSAAFDDVLIAGGVAHAEIADS